MAKIRVIYYNAYCQPCDVLVQKSDSGRLPLKCIKCPLCKQWRDVVSSSAHKLTGSVEPITIHDDEDRNASNNH